MGEYFFDSIAVAVIEFAANAIGEQAANYVLRDVVLACREQMSFELRHVIDLRAVRYPGLGLHFLRVDALEVFSVAGKVVVLLSMKSTDAGPLLGHEGLIFADGVCNARRGCPRGRGGRGSRCNFPWCDVWRAGP